MRTPEPGIPQRVQRLSIGMHCAECHAAVDVAPRDLLAAFIAGVPVHCPSCEESYDVWGRMVEQLKFGVFGGRYAAVGANVVVAELVLRRDQPLLLDFQKFGIPDTAEIEEIALTPASASGEGWLSPVFLKDPVPGQPASETPVIYPVPVGAGAEGNQISILIVWTSQPAAADPARGALFAAVRAAHRSDNLGAIISSNVAMELALGSVFFTTALQLDVPPPLAHVKIFQQSGGTVSGSYIGGDAQAVYLAKPSSRGKTGELIQVPRRGTKRIVITPSAQPQPENWRIFD